MDGPGDRRRIRVRLTALENDATLGQHAEVAKLQSRMREHHEGILRFTYMPGVPADNNASERDIRPVAVHRRVTGGTRSPEGSRTLGHWISIVQTLRKNRRPLARRTRTGNSALGNALPPSCGSSDAAHTEVPRTQRGPGSIALATGEGWMPAQNELYMSVRVATRRRAA